MKKLFAMLLVLVMVFSLAACSANNDPDPTQGASEPPASQAGTEQSAEPSQAPTEEPPAPASGETADTYTPDCILCDDTEVGTTDDTPVDVYAAGCFNPEKVTVAEGYTITQADKDKLRAYSIVFKAATPAP